MSNTPSNNIPYVPENTVDPAAGLNDALRVIDTLLQLRVVSISNTLPGSPADGSRYLVGTSPTGVALGHAGQVATYVADGGFYLFDNANYLMLGAVLYVNNGSNVWSVYSGTGEPAIAPGTTSQFWRGDKVWTDFAATVRGTLLTGYVAGSMTAIAATDTVLQAFAKIGAYLAGLGTAAFKNTGTSGNTVPLLDGTNTWSAKQTIDANIEVTGTARRIQGDFSNATILNRTMFQTSTINGNSTMVVIPNGTSQIANLQFLMNEDPALGSRGIVGINGAAGEFTFDSTNTGGLGTIWPMRFKVGGLTGIVVGTDGSVTMGYPVVFPTYTVAGLPSAATYARGQVYVSNMAGGAEMAFSDGTNWRRFSDRSVAS